MTLEVYTGDIGGICRRQWRYILRTVEDIMVKVENFIE